MQATEQHNDPLDVGEPKRLRKSEWLVLGFAKRGQFYSIHPPQPTQPAPTRPHELVDFTYESCKFIETESNCRLGKHTQSIHGSPLSHLRWAQNGQNVMRF